MSYKKNGPTFLNLSDLYLDMDNDDNPSYSSVLKEKPEDQTSNTDIKQLTLLEISQLIIPAIPSKTEDSSNLETPSKKEDSNLIDLDNLETPSKTEDSSNLETPSKKEDSNLIDLDNLEKPAMPSNNLKKPLKRSKKEDSKLFDFNEAKMAKDPDFNNLEKPLKRSKKEDSNLINIEKPQTRSMTKDKMSSTYLMTYEDIVYLLKVHGMLDERKISIIGSSEQLLVYLSRDSNKKRKIYICCNNNHWFTMVYLREHNDKRIVFWDSFGTKPSLDYLSTILSIDPKITVSHIGLRLQKDAKSCGWFAIIFANYFLTRIDITQKNYINNIRLDLDTVKRDFASIENKPLVFVGNFNS